MSVKQQAQGRPRIAIIGAGTSGVICLKTLHQQGLDVQAFEAGSYIGGLWRFGNDNGMSSIYRSLHINTSKRVMEVSDYPMPDHMAEFPSHTEISAYFESYVDHFKVRELIRFNTTVLNASKALGSGWLLRLRGPDGQERSEHFAQLVVANGHHWDPRMVDFPGHFDGPQFHAHHYVDLQHPVDLAGKRVVVIGAGNSAMDVACELGQALRANTGTQAGPARVVLSQRSGVWIAPKVLGNMPQDRSLRHPMKRPGFWEVARRRFVPRGVRTAVYNLLAEHLVRSIAGDPQRVGLKAPKERFSQRHGTVSQEIHARLIHGDIVPKGNITELLGDRVRFEDGSIEPADVLIHCSGYRITFPFFAPELLSAPNNEIALWQRMIDPRHADLYFIGLVQPKCSMMPIAELQSNFLAALLSGSYQLPSAAEMQAQGRAVHEGVKSGFTKSESHTIQIDCGEYSYELYREWDRGRVKRAA
jgi:cation diffusion facilitator CzcD-associated flavoprotein CzcO